MGQNLHNMQHADERGQAEEPRISLHEHPLDFVHLSATSGTLLLGRLREAMGHGSEDLELPVGHRLECDLQGKHGRRAVNLDIL